MATPPQSTSENDTPDATEAALIRAWLAEHDYSCVHCGYNLKGVESLVCSECGKTITLQIRPPDPSQGVWLTTLIALVFVTTIPFIHAVSIFVEMMSVGIGGVNLSSHIVFVNGILDVVLIAFFIRYRKLFLLMRLNFQWAVALVTLAIPALPIVVVLLLTRLMF